MNRIDEPAGGYPSPIQINRWFFEKDQRAMTPKGGATTAIQVQAFSRFEGNVGTNRNLSTGTWSVKDPLRTGAGQVLWEVCVAVSCRQEYRPQDHHTRFAANGISGINVI